MNNISKFVHAFAIILFVTTAITCLGISQEEKNLIECNRKLERIQEIESSRDYKISKILSHPASLVGIPAISWGAGIIIYFATSLFIEDQKIRALIGILTKVVVGRASYRAQDKAYDHLEKVQKLKKDLIERREKAMKAFLQNQ